MKVVIVLTGYIVAQKTSTAALVRSLIGESPLVYLMTPSIGSTLHRPSGNPAPFVHNVGVVFVIRLLVFLLLFPDRRPSL